MLHWDLQTLEWRLSFIVDQQPAPAFDLAAEYIKHLQLSLSTNMEEDPI